MNCTILCLIYIEQCLSFNIPNETCISFQDKLDDNFEKESNPAIEVVLDFSLGAVLRMNYRPGRCFCSKNHLFPYYAYLL